MSNPDSDPRNSIKLKLAQEKCRESALLLARVRRDLKKEIARRLLLEKNFQKSELQHKARLKESLQMQEQLRHLTHQVLLAQEEERLEISRELHDDIAQTLTAINVHLATFTTHATIDADDLREKIALTQQLVEKSFKVVHRFARDLRPTLLDDLGLIPAIHSYLKEFCKGTNVQVVFTAFAGVEKLSNARRTVLYRVAQAAITNISQHAEATHVEVCILKVKNTIAMTIHDNGRAFPVEVVLGGAFPKSLGLLGMRERVEMVGGRFLVESAPGKGTTVTVQVPFVNSKTRKPATNTILEIQL